MISATVMKPLFETKAQILIFAALLLRLTGYSDSIAQDFWQQTNGPLGGFVNILTVDSAGMLYAGTDNAVVHRSSDNGQSWQRTGPGLELRTSNSITPAVTALAINAEGEIFAGTNFHLFRSPDHGETWILLHVLQTRIVVNALAINARGDIFVGLSSGIYRSSDKGDTWNQVSNSFGIQALAIDATGNIYAVLDNTGLIRSTDNGDSWIEINQDLPERDLHFLSLSPQGDIYVVSTRGSLLRSLDKGETWEYVDGGTFRFYRAAVTYTGEIYAAGFPGIISRSTDNGKSWKIISNGLRTGENRHIESLIIMPDGFVFAGMSGSGVFRLGDNGESWSKTSQGMTNTMF